MQRHVYAQRWELCCICNDGNVTHHCNLSAVQVVAVRLFKGQATESACMQHRLHLEKALELGEPSSLLHADTYQDACKSS